LSAAEDLHSKADGYDSILSEPANRNEALQRAYDNNVKLKEAMGSDEWEARMAAEIEEELGAFRREARFE
jgi:hypothetical protein